MAFTSKVVILLLVASLAWWQASAEGGSTKTIVESLDNITMMTNALTTKVNESILNDIDNDSDKKEVLKGFKGIVNAFALGNDRLKKVSDLISDGATIVKAVERLVAAQEKLIQTTKAKLFTKSRSVSLAFFRHHVYPDLDELAKAARVYEKNLVKLLPTKSQKDAAELFRKLHIAILILEIKIKFPRQ